jgi:signal transduction histidine kinase
MTAPHAGDRPAATGGIKGKPQRGGEPHAERRRSGGFWFPLSGRRVWGDISFNLTMLPLGILGFIWVMTTLVVGVALGVTLIGLPLTALSLAGARPIGSSIRRFARRTLGVEIKEPSPPPRAGSLFGWVRTRLSDTVAWRTELYLFIVFPIGLAFGIVTLVFVSAGIGVAPLLYSTPFVVRGFAATHKALVRGLLGPTRASERIRTLERSRGAVVDDAAVKLRRIERDLHDGAQARIVSLAMNLGMAKERLDRRDGTAEEGSDRARELIAAAHRDAKAALIELRDLARGIHPPVLDAGLEPALASLAAHSVIPVDLRVDLPWRPSQAIETIAYYCAAELLTNVAKHSGAHGAAIHVTGYGERVALQVTDDGHGGADTRRGSGLRGLLDRVGAVDGTIEVNSPNGGPTVITVDLPLTA